MRVVGLGLRVLGSGLRGFWVCVGGEPSHQRVQRLVHPIRCRPGLREVLTCLPEVNQDRILKFRVWGLGFEVWGSRFGVCGLRFEVWGLGFEVGVWGLRF